MKNVIIISLTIIVFGTGCETDSTKQRTDAKPGQLQYDSSKTAILMWDKSMHVFDSIESKPAPLTSVELVTLDSLIIVAVALHNKELNLPEGKDYEIHLDSLDYKRQLVIVEDLAGEKVVWVNYLCSTHNDLWKTQITIVHDGGSCFFNLKLNLTTRKCYDLIVNGLA